MAVAPVHSEVQEQSSGRGEAVGGGGSSDGEGSGDAGGGGAGGSGEGGGRLGCGGAGGDGEGGSGAGGGLVGSGGGCDSSSLLQYRHLTLVEKVSASLQLAETRQ